MADTAYNQAGSVKKIRIGELLIQSGMITKEQLQEALAFQKTTEGAGQKIGDILISRGFISEDDFLEVLHRKLEIPIVDLTHYRVHMGAAALLPQEVALKYTILPLEFDSGTIVTAMRNPTDYYAIEEIELASGRKVRPVLAKAENIRQGIERIYEGTISHDVISSANREFEEQLSAIDEEALQRVNSAPVVQLVDAVLKQAKKMRASDIHIEPMAENIRIRFRVDGELLEIMTLKASLQNSLITRIKIMSDMDIAEKRMPQDGRFTAHIGNREVNTRVASMPTVYGEKIVIRLLGDTMGKVMNIENLGMNDGDQKLFRKILSVPSGIVLVSGPTGSGKTTTLYSAMEYLSDPSVNIVSIEDPVEKAITGMNQMQINVKAGITFASGLRSLLRQDPDIIMVGEVRDTETAQMAARAAITGHLVLSTIHTNDSVSTFARLIDMGVEPYIAASAVMGVISQRLVRLLCPKCRKRVTVTEEMHALVPELQTGDTVYEPGGCIHCNHTGYFGRTAVYEILTVTEKMRALISSGAAVEELRSLAEKSGSHTLRENMLKLVKGGKSTIPELLRITFSLDQEQTGGGKPDEE